jgi:hypothetical protein
VCAKRSENTTHWLGFPATSTISVNALNEHVTEGGRQKVAFSLLRLLSVSCRPADAEEQEDEAKGADQVPTLHAEVPVDDVPRRQPRTFQT